MNMVMFTPANKKSAIGRMVAKVTQELIARGCRVTIVKTESKHLLGGSVANHDFGTRLIPWHDERQIVQEIGIADVAIYHIGDSFLFHEGCLHWLARFSGIVCLHDFFLGHLFYAWSQIYREQALDVLRVWYGEKIAQLFFSFTDSETFINETHEVAPMIEWICSQADGVVVHSQWGVKRVLDSCSGVIRVIPLAYDIPHSISPSYNSSKNKEKLSLLTLGHINPNKRVKSVLQAIANSSILRSQVSYRLVGAVTPEMKDLLFTLANELKVNLIVSGEVDDLTLAQAITETDVVVSLRFPALEGASASAIEAMLYGKAIIVTNTGFYSEIPDSCAIKISPSNEIPEIQLALEKLLQDRDKIQELGTNAQCWASQTFTASNYATQLIEMVEQVAEIVPAKRAIDRFCVTLRQWSSYSEFLVSDELTNPLRIFGC